MMAETSECGGCFTEMIELGDTHPSKHGIVGQLCPNCYRVYLDDLDEYDYTIRCDPKLRGDDD